MFLQLKSREGSLIKSHTHPKVHKSLIKELNFKKGLSLFTKLYICTKFIFHDEKFY